MTKRRKVADIAAGVYADQINQAQAANYGALCILLIERGMFTVDELRRARLRALSSVDQLHQADIDEARRKPMGEEVLELLLGKKGDDDE